MFRAKLRMKMTPQRMAIMDCLSGNTQHSSATEVYRAVSRKFPTISFATVYNTLRTFKDRGLPVGLSLDPEKKRFDANPAPHHHLICVECKKIPDVTRTFDLSVANGGSTPVSPCRKPRRFLWHLSPMRNAGAGGKTGEGAIGSSSMKRRAPSPPQEGAKRTPLKRGLRKNRAGEAI